MVCLLTACGASTPSAKARIDLKPLPAGLTCADPVLLPERELPKHENEELWGLDRVNLKKCGRNNRILIKNYEELRNNLTVPGK